MPAEPEFEQSLYEIETTLKGGLRSFAKWCAEHWTINDTERQQGDFSEEYQRGWNTAMDAVDAALDSYLDEHTHG